MANNERFQLSEKDFIHEEYGRNPFPFWSWLLAVVGFSLLFSFALSKYSAVLTEHYADSPFLQVTNRQFSLFLWQNPSFMRVNAKNKNSYLPAFQYVEKIGLNPEYAEEYVQAPPEIIFLYHTWHRLLSNEIPIGKISANEFQVFLSDAEEWQPRYWSQAPSAYIELINQLSQFASEENLNRLPAHVLPIDVRQAFTGWKNYFYEKDKINQMPVSGSDLKKFISKYPHYARNFWRNIAGESYLQKFTRHSSLELVPNDEIAPFLRAALYTWLREQE